jgi:hypothetical protein
MFENLHDINLDPTVRPPKKNRLVKLAGIPLVLLVVGLGVYLITQISVFPRTVRVENDTAGALVCYQRYQNNGHDFVQDAGRIPAADHASIQAKSSCAVFDSGGRYVSCLIVPDDSSVKSVAASSADRSVSAETCVYPR